MTLDPAMKAFVDILAAAGKPPNFAEIGVAAAREVSAQAGAMLGTGPAMAREEDLTVAGAGTSLPARLYVPEGEVTALLVYLHGGGWVVGTLDGYNAVLRRFAKGSGCAILSIDYRMAPEHPFPTPVEDCYAATVWADQHRAELGLGAGLPLVVGGDSAGGNLTAAVALLARDRGGPRLAAQLLIYPATDCDFERASYVRFTEKLPLTSSAMFWFWDQYVADPAERAHPLASPIRAESLEGLPPALLVVAGYDPLRDEADAYGERLRQSGVPVRAMTWEGLTHGFFQFAEILEPGGLACDEIAAELRAMLKG